MNIKEILFTTLRRRLVDDDLFACQYLLTGKVLDLGGGRTRGKFPHGRELGWTILDIDFNLRPIVVGDAQILPFANNAEKIIYLQKIFTKIPNLVGKRLKFSEIDPDH